MAVDLFQLIFQEILQISPRLMSQYTTVQDQLLYLILIPHVILFLFIYAFSKGIVVRIIGEAKGSFVYLLSFVLYIFIVMSGWYGTFLIPIFNTWLIILLVVGLFLFAMSAFLAPGRLTEAKKFASAAAETVSAKTTGVAAKKKALEDEIDLINDQIKEIENEKRRLQMSPGGLSDDSNTYFSNQVASLKAQKKKLEHELNKL